MLDAICNFNNSHNKLKNMKTKHIVPGIFILLLVVSSMFSCNNYLVMPSQTGFNKDSIFVNYRNTEIYLYDLYQQVPKILLDWAEILNGPSRVTLTDEAGTLALQSAYNSLKVYAGAVNSTWFTATGGSGEDIYDRHWQTIRKCFVMLENIDKVPDATSRKYRDESKGECQTLIAMEYFEMWKRYGGIPIIKQSLSSDFPIIVRQSVQDVYNYIIELCDQAISQSKLSGQSDQSIGIRSCDQSIGLWIKGPDDALRSKSLYLILQHPIWILGRVII